MLYIFLKKKALFLFVFFMDKCNFFGTFKEHFSSLQKKTSLPLKKKKSV